MGAHMLISALGLRLAEATFTGWGGTVDPGLHTPSGFSAPHPGLMRESSDPEKLHVYSYEVKEGK